MLYEAFHTSVLGGESVPHDKRLYYIPEVDTQMFNLLKRSSKEEKVSDVLPDPAKKPQTEHKPTLGEILNVLDGVPERHGHILVLDTNHLQQLDPALIRPGRVDRILSWKKMSKTSIRKYLEHYYKTNLPKTCRLPDCKFSAAELQSIVTQHTNWKNCVKCLHTHPGFAGGTNS
jgi:SpoVK/Ycf46/Vps4 family AAA+-type ATPase